MTGLAYAEAGQGRALVLLHAFPLTRRMWQFQYGALSTGLRLVTPDLTGFGESVRATQTPDLGVVADAVVALCAELGLDDIVLGGLSMGGYVAMEVLRRRPGLAGALILADTKSGVDTEAARGNRERIASLLEDSGSSRVLVDEVLPTLIGDTTRAERPETVQLVRTMVDSADPAAAAWAQRAMAGRRDSGDVLHATDVLALVVVGTEDTLSPPSEAEAMCAALPRARLVRIAGAGHLSALEAPTAFNRAVLDLLELSARPGGG